MMWMLWFFVATVGMVLSMLIAYAMILVRRCDFRYARLAAASDFAAYESIHRIAQDRFDEDRVTIYHNRPKDGLNPMVRLHLMAQDVLDSELVIIDLDKEMTQLVTGPTADTAEDLAWLECFERARANPQYCEEVEPVAELLNHEYGGEILEVTDQMITIQNLTLSRETQQVVGKCYDETRAELALPTTHVASRPKIKFCTNLLMGGAYVVVRSGRIVLCINKVPVGVALGITWHNILCEARDLANANQRQLAVKN